MAFNDLLSSSFLFSIAIIIILIGGIFAYVSYRMSEQDHKITSMLGLISTMAEELQFFRSNLSKGSLEQSGLSDEHSHHHTHIILDPNNLVTEQSTLISVSDDDVSDDDVSDDDVSDDDVSDDDVSDDDVSDDDVSDDDVSDDDDVLDNIVDLEEADLEEADLEDIQNIKSIHLEEPIDLHYIVEHELVHDLDHSDELLATDLHAISMSDLEEIDKKPDYKKMSLTKLKEVIVEKNIVTDASKLKKNDILKLLGVE